MTKQPTLLVDADLLAYRATAASETEVDWGDDVWTLTADLKIARDVFQRDLETAVRETKAGEVIMCLTSPDNWRKAILPSYKGNRTKTRKPTGYVAFIKWIGEVYQTYAKPTLEADDILGILSTHPKIVEGPRIIYSQDKDMRTIPGQLWTGKELLTITEEAADLWHLTQTLTGDTTDGYAGCPGIGPKRAEEILKAADKWRAIVAAFTKAGLTEADALVQARVARICRHTDYNFEKKEVNPWTPTTP